MRIVELRADFSGPPFSKQDKAMPNEKKAEKSIAIRVPLDMAERVDAEAAKELITPSAWVRRAILQTLARIDEQKK